MSSEGGDESGKDLRFFILFVLGLFFLWAVTGAGENGGILGTASTTENGATTTEDGNVSTPQTGTVTRREAQEEIRSAAREVDRLREDVRAAKIWGTHSPLKGSVRLNTGDTQSTNERAEYLVLSAQQSGDEPIDISGFRIESYVTGVWASIPLGTSILQTGRVNTAGPIMLYPGDDAIVLTGKSPVGISFKENSCTGYLDQYQDYTPSISRSCPAPQEVLEDSGRIALDDDSCYEYVRTLPYCRAVVTDLDDVRPSLSNACMQFVKNELTYNGCVLRYAADPDFEEHTWRIFLNQEHELWREEREIIRLLDREGKTIDVLEY